MAVTPPYGLEVCSLIKAQIRSLDYAVSFCYRKIFSVKSHENARLCMDIFNCDEVATLLTNRKQKFAGSFVQIYIQLYSSRSERQQQNNN